MTGINDLFASERGCFAIFLTLICTVMLFMGKMTVDQWMSYTQWIAIALIVGKTVTTAITTMKGNGTIPINGISTKLGTIADPPPPVVPLA